MTPTIKRKTGRVRAYFRGLGLAVLGAFSDDLSQGLRVHEDDVAMLNPYP